MSRRKINLKDKTYLHFYPYQKIIITKFLNNLMYDGKKIIAEQLLLNTFTNLKQFTQVDPLIIFIKAIENAKPLIELKSVRIGGITYKVPIEILPNKQISKGIKSLIMNARKRSGHKMEIKLTNEILDCYYNEGTTIKQKEDIYKLAEANRAYAHFRW